MSDLVVSGFQLQNLQWPGTAFTFELYCDGQWADSVGVTRQSSPVGKKEGAYQIVQCTKSGTVGTVPTFTTQTTLDAKINNNVRITAIIRDQNGTIRDRGFWENFFLQVSSIPVTHAEIEIYNQGRALFLPPSTYLDQIGVQNFGDTRWGTAAPLASDVIYGKSRLSVLPVSALAPIAVGDNDPRIPKSGGTGVGVLAASLATTIASAIVTASSAILVLPTDEGSTGRLYGFNRIVGVSFDVISDNGADAGNFKWFIYA